MTETRSPSKPKAARPSPDRFNFAEAMNKIRQNYIVSKDEWKDPVIHFAQLKDKLLTIHNETGYHDWIVAEEDMDGDDWFVVRENN